MTSISGVTFEEAWNTVSMATLMDYEFRSISTELLRRNKAAVGRKQDLADLDYL